MLSESQFQMVNIDDLILDIDNPRIKKWFEYSKEPPNSAQIKLALGVAAGDEKGDNATTFDSLKHSIQASG